LLVDVYRMQKKAKKQSEKYKIFKESKFINKEEIKNMIKNRQNSSEIILNSV